MKKIIFSAVCLLAFIACNQNHAPNVSNIDAPVRVLHFEDDFFSLDTLDVSRSLSTLQEKYPGFLKAYIQNILGLPYQTDSTVSPEVAHSIISFIRDYRSIKDSADLRFSDFAKYEREIQQSFKYVKYYFPKYQLPQNIVTFIGPFDAFFSTSFGIQGDILMKDYAGIGLQLHLGADFPFFSSDIGQNLYPLYVSAHFTPDYIVINSIFNIVDDMFPHSSGKPPALIENMVEMGKKYYLMTQFLPEAKEEKLLGYTAEQMKDSRKNEAVIWDFFLSNDLLNSTNPEIVKNYVGPAPSTQAFGPQSPGNIGSFAGLMIVKKYMEKYPETSLSELIGMSPRSVYEQSKYKPR